MQSAYQEREITIPMSGLLLALTLITPNHLVAPTTTTLNTSTAAVMTVVRELASVPQLVPTTTVSTPPVLIGPLTSASSAPAKSPTPVSAPTQVAQPPLTFATLPAPWGCIAFHESTNNLTAVNYQSGTEGAFQFMPSTWQEFAPPSFPASPLQATLTQQFIVAKAVEAARGFGQWETAPLCGA